MIFVGEYKYSVDPQGRISLPGEWRLEEESSWILLPESRCSLMLTTENDLMEFFKDLKKLSMTDPKLKMAATRIGAAARICRCDRQGRLSLPKTLLESVGISKEIALLGAITHIRIFEPANWDIADVDSELNSCGRSINKLTGDNGALTGLLEGVMDHE